MINYRSVNSTPVAFMKMKVEIDSFHIDDVKPTTALSTETHTLSRSVIHIYEDFLKDSLEIRLTLIIDGEVKSAELVLSNEFIYNSAMDQSYMEKMVVMTLCEKIGYPDLSNVILYRHFSKDLKNFFTSPSKNINPGAKFKESETDQLASVASQLPGVQAVVSYPCYCDIEATVYRVIMHLNDREKWSREKIADWLDELQDKQGYDFTFKVEIGEEND